MTADKIVSVARSYVGIVEKQTNNVVFNTAYYGKEVNGSQYPWCAVFVWYVFKEAGASSLYYDGQKTAYCPTLMAWFKKRKKLVSTPRVGDVVFYNFSGGKEATHVGIVSEVLSGSIKAIEGNTSSVNQSNGGMVMERNRKLSVCIGFGRPDYGVSKETSMSAYTGTINTKTSNLMVRTGPGSSYPVVECFPSGLPKGTKVGIDKESDGWGRLVGTTYWMALKYITK